ncbi:MAG: hypothetical protein ACOX81_02465 [Candidatus Heteroscillospira sp.]|jgi:hypothetical protein
MRKHLRTWIGIGALAAAMAFSAAAALAPDTQAATESEGYVLRESCGRVAVFLPNGAQPVETTDIELKSLPAADRIKLTDGVFVENMEQLARILEDLGS